MGKRDMIIFFSIVLTVHTAINLFIFWHGWTVIPEAPAWKAWYIALCVLLWISFPLSRFLERVWLSGVSNFFVWVGSFWLGGMTYFFLLLIGLDLILVANRIVQFLPASWTNAEGAKIIAVALVGIVGSVLVGGFANAVHPRVRVLELSVNGKREKTSSISIAVASDIHLGTIVCKERLERIVRKINGLKPDLILLPGDVLDEDVGPVIRQNLGETLKQLHAPYGVFGVTGNHEYYGGVESACRYLEDHGIRMLRDEVVQVNGTLNLVGREDRTFRQFNGRNRKPLEELMRLAKDGLPTILMDHQPGRLHEAEENGVALQLSGHTHHGQLWPFNFITKRVYELSWGYMMKGGTHIYVSCGVGTWGPPLRVGNRPEILHIKLKLR